ncbi:hypothetical protein EJ06DRAFT_585857 [Trichodelitschia bisporula]|uniref:RNA polymerase I-specific transcription initiation factor RRN6-like protein n=1 Tax=Trichodelitschia bisporula TaxID=703511 RepID=A0A6G1HHQ0_9PEZI|nr:hypothetical protein EJ06DRAFT_585857 [Trichodelitschia bisporula]
MTDSTGVDHRYGQFGPAFYDVDSARWIFHRRYEQGPVLRAYHDLELELEGSSSLIAAPDAISAGNTDGYERRLNREIETVAKSFPALHPTKPVLPTLLRASEAIDVAQNTFDPRESDLLSYGNATISDGQHNTRPANLLAVSGPGGSLKLVRLQSQRLRTPDNVYALPRAVNEVGWWAGWGAAIQHIHFAELVKEVHGTPLAIRLPASTLFFAPRLRALPVPPAHALPGCSFPSSRIDANFLFEVPSTVGHSDVTFNPWYQQQFAVVDQEAKWTVYEIEKPVHFKKSRPRLIRTADVPDDGDEETTRPAEDGWARVLWTLDVNCFVVCTRRRAVLFNIGHGSEHARLDVFSRHEKTAWILDVRRCVSHPEWIFVLTTVRVLWFTVHIEDGIYKSSLLSSTLHFRDAKDISLKLAVVDEGEDIVATLVSRFNSLVTSFRFSAPEESQHIMSDPVAIPVHRQSGSNHIMQLSLCLLRPRHQTEEAYTLYSMRVLYDDHSVFRNLVYTALDSEKPELEFLPLAPSVTKSVLPLDNFVVSDDEDLQVAKPPPSRFRVKALGTVGDPTIDTSSMFRRITQTLPSGDTTLLPEDMMTIIGTLEEIMLTRPEGIGEPACTFMELSQSLAQVEDLDEASGELSRLCSLASAPDSPHEPVLVAGNLPMGNWFPLGHAGADVTLGDLYDRLLEDMISTLPMEVSGRYRLAKEHVARSIAGELSLAKSCIKLQHPVEEPEELPEPEDFPGRGFAPAFPTSSQGGELPYGSQVYPEPFSDILPTPSATLSMHSQPTFGTASSIVSVKASFARLANYVGTQRPFPIPTSQPSRLLSHWTLGSDPAAYNWTETLLAIEAEGEAEAAAMEQTPKQRARAMARAEKKLRKQRREIQLAAEQAAEDASQTIIVRPYSQPEAPPRPFTLASSPGPGPGFAGSSQPVQSQSQGGLPNMASQVEPGRFGGRPQKKKRVGGF